MIKAPPLGSPAPHNAAAQKVGTTPPAAQGPAPKLQPANIANGAAPVAPAPKQGRGPNAHIIKLMKTVCAQEASIQNVKPARAISCINLPQETGSATFRPTQSNAIDLLIDEAMQAQNGELALVSPADSKYVAGALDTRVLSGFRHAGLLLEETYCTLLSGAKSSLDGAAASYPLGQNTTQQNLLHASDLKFRYDLGALRAVRDAKGAPRERIDAQRDTLIDSIGGTPANTGPGMHMFSIAGVDRRNAVNFDFDALYTGMLRQLAHAFSEARVNGVKTVILSLPGSGEFSKVSRTPGAQSDSRYIESLGCAAADAIHYFGAGLSVLMPTHGPTLDRAVQEYLRYTSTFPANQSGRYFYTRAAQLKQPAQGQPQNPAPQQKQVPQQAQAAAAAQPKQAGLIKQLKKINPLNLIPNIGKPNPQVTPQQPARAPVVSPVQKPLAPPPVPVKPPQIQAQMRAQRNAVIQQGTPMQNMKLADRTMGSLSYKVELTNEAEDSDSEVLKALGPLIVDVNKLTLRRVHSLQKVADVRPNASYEINRRDGKDAGRALLSIRTASNAIELYEAIFSPQHQFALANEVKMAPQA